MPSYNLNALSPYNLNTLIIKRTASNKFPQQGDGGQLVFGYVGKVSEEFVEPVCLGEFIHMLWYTGEQLCGLLFDDSELINHRSIEHLVGILLIGEDPFFLSCPDRRPSADGLLSGDPAVFVVAYDTPEEPVVSGGNIVVVVEQDGGQC